MRQVDVVVLSCGIARMTSTGTLLLVIRIRVHQIKEADDSVSRVDSSVLLSDLGSLILIQITPKERSLSQLY